MYPPTPATEPEGRVGRLSVALPLVLLLAVTGVHLALRHSAGLSPWKGGGFAMFSTVDSPGTRAVRVSVVTGGSEVPALLPAAFGEAVDELRAVTSGGRAMDLAADLARRSWVTGPDGRAVPLVTAGAGAPPRLDVDAVRVEVLRTGYDAAHGVVAAVPVRSVTVAVDG
jgi:hypothetical protein